jgi:uncharacterized protein YoxC
MDKDTPPRNAKSIKLAPLFVIALIFLITLSTVVLASPIGDAFRGAGNRIGGFFNNYANATGPTFLDFFIFAVIFFAICWIGFSSVFKDAKGANVALSVALGLALSTALVYGGKFTIKKLLPFAGMLLVLLALIGLYALLRKFIFTKDTIGSKLLAFLFAVIITIVLVTLLWKMICSGGTCESSGFLKKVFGSESIFGKLFSKIGNAFSGVSLPSPSAPKGRPGPQYNPQLCGNGKKDPGEQCDTGGRPGVPVNLVGGCKSGKICSNCEKCIDQSTSGAVYDHLTGNWFVYLPLITLIPLILGWTRSRKKLKSLAKRSWYYLWPWHIPRKAYRTMSKTLKGVEGNEKEMLSKFKELCSTVKTEGESFNRSRHIVNKIATDIKETIGQEIAFVLDTGHDETDGRNIEEHITHLKDINDPTEKMIITNILDQIESQLDKLNDIPGDIQKGINKLEKVHEIFDEHSEVLKTLKQFNLREKNVLKNMIERIEDNKKRFEAMKEQCDKMAEALESMKDDVEGIVNKDNKDYHKIVEHVKDLRYNALKLNKIFSWKVTLLHYLVERMKEVKTLIHNIHDEEVRRLSEYVIKAKEGLEAEEYDPAVYFASHVLENAVELQKTELSPETQAQLKEYIEKATEVMRSALPEMFNSMIPKIQEELNKSDPERFSKVKEFANNIVPLRFVDRKHNSDFENLVRGYETKMEQLRTLCDRLEAGTTPLTELNAQLTGLGFAPI